MKPRKWRREALPTTPVVVMDKAPPNAASGGWSAQKVAAAAFALLAGLVVFVPEAVGWDRLLGVAQERFGLADGWRYVVPLVLFVAAAQVVGYFATLLTQWYVGGKDRVPPSIGARAFYVVALSALLVSADTSWRLFEYLGITALWERAVLFAVMEIAMVACGVAMRAGVRSTGRPGPARLLGWALCGVAAFGAIAFSGPVVGILRVLLGPVLSLVSLHLALGIEIRSREHVRDSTWERVVREIRERALSRLGLADDERDALTRTRDRAARRTARLALAGERTPFRKWRLEKALRDSNVAHDETARARMLTELAAIRHADELTILVQPSPWGTAIDERPQTVVHTDAAPQTGAEPATTPGEQPGGTELDDAAVEAEAEEERRRSLAEIARLNLAEAVREAWRMNGVVGLPKLEDVEPAVKLLAKHDVEVTPKYVREVRLRDKAKTDANETQQHESEFPELKAVAGGGA